MRQHPLTKQISNNYWILNREIARKIELIKLVKKVKKLLNAILELAKQRKESESRFQITSIQKVANIISEENISALDWEIQGLEGDINYQEQRIKFLKHRKIWIPLG